MRDAAFSPDGTLLVSVSRDGTRLAVDVHLPRGLPADTRVPTVVQSTRYWRAVSLRWPANRFNRDPFVEFFRNNFV